MVALGSTAFSGLVLGAIVLISGMVMNANVNPYSVALNGANPAPGLGAVVWGGAILSIGIMGLFSWLTATAVRWQAPGDGARPSRIRG
ncbi:MAG: hypothetical protein JWM23_528 [Microbacteriaceae bacterium]|nr:hypothetical protein [Microbacteriaceae bacterium]